MPPSAWPSTPTASSWRIWRNWLDAFGYNRFVPAPRLAVLLLCAAAGLIAAPPEVAPAVTKVEPPSWWIGHSINPVRLLIRGRNLQDARAVADRPDLQVGLTRVNAAGTYAFVDVSIAR